MTVGNTTQFQNQVSAYRQQIQDTLRTNAHSIHSQGADLFNFYRAHYNQPPIVGIMPTMMRLPLDNLGVALNRYALTNDTSTLIQKVTQAGMGYDTTTTTIQAIFDEAAQENSSLLQSITYFSQEGQFSRADLVAFAREGIEYVRARDNQPLEETDQ